MTLVAKQGCVIVLSSTHRARNFGSVTSTVIVCLMREGNTCSLGVCVWLTVEDTHHSSGHHGRLKRIVMLCPNVRLCASVPVMCMYLCWNTGKHLNRFPSVCAYVGPCASVCQFTFTHLCLHMFLHMFTLRASARDFASLYFGTTASHKSMPSVKGCSLIDRVACGCIPLYVCGISSQTSHQFSHVCSGPFYPILIGKANSKSCILRARGLLASTGSKWD